MPIYFCKSLVVLALMFRLQIHFGLILHIIQSKVSSSFFGMLLSVVSAQTLEKTFLFPLNCHGALIKIS